MNTNSLPDDLRDLWSRLRAAEKVTEQRDVMTKIITKLVVDLSRDQDALDLVLVECAARPELFELGMCVVMLATEYVREAFRRRLIECGAVFQANRLTVQMRRPFSRDEIVMLGNRYVGGFMYGEQFVADAEKVEGIVPLDLHRLRKQFGLLVDARVPRGLPPR